MTTELSISDVLSEYGASLSPDGFIQKNGKVLSIRPVAKDNRLRFENDKGHSVASGPLTPDWVRSFVERYWYWQK